MRLLVGYDNGISAEITEGLNTGLQVQQKSLADLRNDFQWIKDRLSHQRYADHIAWQENDDEDLDVVRDVLSMMYLFHVDFFPAHGEKTPIEAYTSAGKVLEHYLNNRESYRKLEDILPDILESCMTSRSTARDLYNESGHGRGGGLSFIESLGRGPQYHFHYLGDEGEYALCRAALLPILSAFRWMVYTDESTGRYAWRGGFESVKALWKTLVPKLLRQTRETSVQ